MKLDLHVHTFHSGHTTIDPLSLFMKESYNSPDGVYRRAKTRGMDLVTITDHDEISGALAIADRPDVIVGCEVTAVFPNDGVRDISASLTSARCSIGRFSVFATTCVSCSRT